MIGFGTAVLGALAMAVGCNPFAPIGFLMSAGVGLLVLGILIAVIEDSLERAAADRKAAAEWKEWIAGNK